MKRPRLRDDLAARLDFIRGDVSFDRHANRAIEIGLAEQERLFVAINPEMRRRVNELRDASREAGDTLAVPLD